MEKFGPQMWSLAHNYLHVVPKMAQSSQRRPRARLGRHRLGTLAGRAFSRGPEFSRTLESPRVQVIGRGRLPINRPCS